MAIALNASATTTATTGSSISLSITTTVANCYLLAFTMMGSEDGSGVTLPSISSITATGLTFSDKGGSANAEYKTDVQGAILASAGTFNVTVTFTGALPSDTGAAFSLLAFSGVLTSAPLDHFGVTSSNPGGVTNPTLALTLTSEPDVLFGAIVTQASKTLTGGAGFTAQEHATTPISYCVEFKSTPTSATGAQTVAFTGTVGPNGGALAGALVASGFINGTITTQLTKANIVGAGNTGPHTSGTITTGLRGGFGGVGSAMLTGTVNNHLSGTITTGLTRVSMALAGKETFTGSITQALSGVTMTLEGHTGPHIGGTIHQALSGVSMALSGEFTIPSHSGGIVQHLPGLRQSLAGKEEFVGTIVTNIDSNLAFRVVATTFELFIGHITTNLSRPGQTLSGYEEMLGTIRTRLGSANGAMVANVVEALEIIEGPIVMHLPPFRPLILGATLGAAGAGPWYSWRQAGA